MVQYAGGSRCHLAVTHIFTASHNNNDNVADAICVLASDMGILKFYYVRIIKQKRVFLCDRNAISQNTTI